MTSEEQKILDRINAYAEEALADIDPQKTRISFQLEALKPIMQEIADETGKSRSYLSRKFSKEAGISIQDYILDQRLQAAANMLKFSDFEIADIAEYLCFSSQSYFGDQFKKKNNMTPAEYRKRNKSIEFSAKSTMQ